MAKKGLKRLCGVLAIIAVIAVCGVLRGNVITASAEETYMIKAGTYRFNDVLSYPANLGHNETLVANIPFETVMHVDLTEYGYGVYDVGVNCSAIKLFSYYVGGTEILTIDSSYYAETASQDLSGIGIDLPKYLWVYSGEDESWKMGDWAKVITIPTDTEVSDEFGTWFAENVTRQKQVSGVWKFKDTVTAIPFEKYGMAREQSNLAWMVIEYGCDIVPIMVDGITIKRISPVNTFGDNYVDFNATTFSAEMACLIEYEGEEIYTAFSSEHISSLQVDFGTEPQTVSAEFYEWLTANAEPFEPETITENIELPKDSVEYMWLYENHVEKNQFGDIQGPFATDILDGLNIKGVYKIDLSKGLTSEQLAFIGNADEVMFEIDFVGKYGVGLTWSNTITSNQLICLTFIGDEFSYQKEYADNVSEVASIIYKADEIKGKHITDMYLTFSSKYISNKNVDVGLKEFECKITATTSEEIREYVLYDKYTEEDVNISILDKITNGFANIGNQVKKAVTDAVTELFVPSEEDMVAQYDKWDTLMADRFGAVYESSQIIDSFVDSIQVSDTQETIEFPVVSLDIVGTTFEFGGWEVDIIPDGFQWLVDILKLITNIGCTVLFVNGMRTRYESVVK